MWGQDPPLGITVTAFAGLRLLRLFLAFIRKKILEDKHYLLVLRTMFKFREIRKPVFESLPNSQ